MIGGFDIPIRTRAGDSSLVAAARAIRRYWPEAVFENGTTGERYHSYWDSPLDQLEEVFVYRDLRSADIWDKEGAIPDVYNSMIHLISDEGLITVVVDEKDSGIMEMVRAISSALEDGILNADAVLEAA